VQELHLKKASRWRQHLALDVPHRNDRPVWVHACSVGEVSSVVPLIEGVLAMGHAVHLSVVTDTGFAHAKKLFEDKVSIAYLPWDFPGLMRRMIAHLDPSLLLLTETEFWPGMLRTCHKRGIPVIGINTRISDRSFPRYHATRFLWKRWLGNVDLFLAQDVIDGERLAAMGVGASRIQCVGHLKYAVKAPVVDTTALRQRLDATGRRPVLLAGSTHDNEEETLCRMFSGWKKLVPELLLAMVPRHPQRFAAVAEIMNDQGLHTARWSQGSAGQDVDAVLIDEMGMLGKLYSIADIVFIGGSLIPHGGQNPLESAVCGRGVITGPHTHNFNGIMQDMKKANAAVQCRDAAEVDASIQRFLTHHDELRQLHAHAAEFMHDRVHVAERMMQAIEPWLPNRQTEAGSPTP